MTAVSGEGPEIRLDTTRAGFIAREYVRKKRVDVYATKLQSVFRGFHDRQRVKELQLSAGHGAAVKLQAFWRGRQCRQAILRDMYYWCSAFQIQRVFRKRYRRKHRAATARPALPIAFLVVLVPGFYHMLRLCFSS